MSTNMSLGEAKEGRRINKRNINITGSCTYTKTIFSGF